MYEIVQNKRQQKEFERTWEYFCKKYNWLNDPYSLKGIRYNLLSKEKYASSKKIVIGTVEFIPYDPESPTSTVESRVEFSKFNDVRTYQSRTWEIDKFCISENYQRKGHFESFFNIIYDHTKRTESKFYIALMEKKFYRMMRINFGIDVQKKGNEIKGPETTLIPVIIDIEKLMLNKAFIDRLGDQGQLLYEEKNRISSKAFNFVTIIKKRLKLK